MANEPEDRRESVAHMMSEFFRELAALILVFVPLDYLLKGDTIGGYFWYETAAVLVFSGFLFVVGILCERGMKVIHFLSQLHLAIAAALMTGSALVVGGVTFILASLFERCNLSRARHSDADTRTGESSQEKHKAAHA